MQSFQPAYFGRVGKATWQISGCVERIELTPDGGMHIRLDVMVADSCQRHKSDDFNSFLMHLFF